MTTSDDWRRQANCRGADRSVFFPDQGGNISYPKAICAGCTVRTECFNEALATGERFGIWGGSTEKERRPIRMKQKAST
jgi:WhiB family redox-sensing transcriptional regulator